MMVRATLLLIIVSCVAAKAAAHDFWLEPSNFHPAKDEPVAIRLMVGDRSHTEAVARNDARIERFTITDAAGERTVPGRNGSDPAGYLDSVPGSAIVAYRSKPARHSDMPAGRFESYLREEGLERIIALRAAKYQSKEPGREIFSRSAKAWLSSDEGGLLYRRPLGFRFEIIPESQPGEGSPLRIRLLFEGQPVEGVLVSAVSADGPPVSRRSDREGMAGLPIDRPGRWMVKAVHMIPAAGDSGADWESIWATLTFEQGESVAGH